MAFVRPDQQLKIIAVRALFSQNGNYSSEAELSSVDKISHRNATSTTANDIKHTFAVMFARLLIVLSAIACALAFQSITVSRNALSQRQVRLKSETRVSLCNCKRSTNQMPDHTHSNNSRFIGKICLNSN
jgi:cytochrome c biogenesis factor